MCPSGLELAINRSSMHVKQKVKATEDFVHKALECMLCVPEPKWHPKKLNESEWSSDSCLKNVCGLNRDLVIRP